MAHETLTTDELQVVVGDNEAGDEAHDAHRAGYNGVWSLTGEHAPDNCFVPAVAGLNLEHLMDDLFMTEAGGEIFEPRQHPMRLERLSDAAVQLVQEVSPLTGVESVTTFTVQPPHAIDMTFEATLTRAPRAGRRFGFFWASYMNAPELPGLQFLGADGYWQGLSPDGHGDDSGNTVCHASVAEATWGDDQLQYNGHSLAHSFSRRRFDRPLMFGRPGDGSMLFLQMFDQSAPVRLCMSPTGGGSHAERRLHNPAWDFQYIIDAAEPGTRCRLRSRVVYKPWAGRHEVEPLFADWVAELD
jgi:hypothetical protein